MDFADAHEGTEAAREEESDEDVVAADAAAVAAADVAAAAADVAVAATDVAAVVAEGTGRGRGNAVDSAVCTHRAVKKLYKRF